MSSWNHGHNQYFGIGVYSQVCWKKTVEINIVQLLPRIWKRVFRSFLYPEERLGIAKIKTTGAAQTLLQNIMLAKLFIYQQLILVSILYIQFSSFNRFSISMRFTIYFFWIFIQFLFFTFKTERGVKKSYKCIIKKRGSRRAAHAAISLRWSVN